MAEKVQQIKLILLGDEKVGKTSFFNKYSTNIFPEEYSPSIKVQNKKNSISINGESLNIQLWDTPGNELKHKLYISIYVKTNGIIVLFNINNKESFENIFKKWIPNFFGHLKIKKNENFPIIILGNFSDIKDKRISNDEIKNKLKEIDNYSNYFFYQEFSIKNMNISDFINKVILFVRNRSKIEIIDTKEIDDKKKMLLLKDNKESEENKELEILKEKIREYELEKKTLNEKVNMLEGIKKITKFIK